MYLNSLMFGIKGNQRSFNIIDVWEECETTLKSQFKTVLSVVLEVCLSFIVFVCLCLSVPLFIFVDVLASLQVSLLSN